MRHSIGLAWAAGFLIASAAPLHAQTELQRAAEILRNRQTAPPPPARVEPPRVETTRRTTVVVVPQREIVVVDRVRARHGWWRNPGYQVITVYYDGRSFYRRAFDRRPLRKVVVYRRGARYYIDEGQWRREHRLHYGRDYRWNDDDKRRYDDKWKDDDRRSNDDRWRNDDKRNDDDRWRGDDRRNDDHDRDGRKGNNGRHLGHDKDRDRDKDKD